MHTGERCRNYRRKAIFLSNKCNYKRIIPLFHVVDCVTTREINTFTRPAFIIFGSFRNTATLLYIGKEYPLKSSFQHMDVSYRWRTHTLNWATEMSRYYVCCYNYVKTFAYISCCKIRMQTYPCQFCNREARNDTKYTEPKSLNMTA